MARDDKFKIKFDGHGNLVVDDPEFQRRLLFLLQRDGEIVLRLNAGTPIPLLGYTPNPDPEPVPPDDEPKPRLWWCPNAMCMCGALKVVDSQAFEDIWGGIGPDGMAPPPVRER